MAEAAPRFVHLFGADYDFLGVRSCWADQALGSGGRIAADHANCRELRHFFSHAEELWHRAEGKAAKIHVEAGDDHSHPSISEALRDFDDRVVKELSLVDAGNPSIV